MPYQNLARTIYEKSLLIKRSANPPRGPSSLDARKTNYLVSGGALKKSRWNMSSSDWARDVIFGFQSYFPKAIAKDILSSLGSAPDYAIARTPRITMDFHEIEKDRVTDGVLPRSVTSKGIEKYILSSILFQKVSYMNIASNSINFVWGYPHSQKSS
jgi:hypothetical protein